MTEESDSIDYLAICRAYADNFEQIFRVTLIKDLECDSEARERTLSWFNSQRAFIHLIVSVEPPPLVLAEPHRQSVAEWERTNLVCAYTYALIAYYRVCDVLGRPKFPGYTPNALLSKLPED